ncbi:hypothetical protein C5E16_07995 [Clavibacter michiganensis]|uniref:Uncharacterized protein n=1 Tax=Clavibacter michiganensis TaxID=28447 RepID=A0A2S5VU45_9MICO|nr:DUF6264 family protein [Clavibacter michiganensis]PPF68085.1 hypothetical protein C5E16_07995 [Clavibacter michiganensis]
MSYDEYEHAFDGPVRPAGRTPRAGRRVPRERAAPGWGDRVAALVLLGLEGAFSYAAYLGVILGSEIFNRCSSGGRTCDYALGDRILLVGMIAVPVVVVLSAVAVVVRLVRGRRAWWLPIAGSAALVAVVYLYWGAMGLAAS